MDAASSPNDPPSEYSLASHAGLLLPCLTAAAPATVIEIGAFRGELTRVLLGWAADAEVKVTAIEPEPTPELLELSDAHPELELARETSLEALRRLPAPDRLPRRRLASCPPRHLLRA